MTTFARMNQIHEKSGDKRNPINLNRRVPPSALRLQSSMGQLPTDQCQLTTVLLHSSTGIATCSTISSPNPSNAGMCIGVFDSSRIR